MYGSKSYKGRYKPTNPLKYQGDVNNITYRSSWELKFMRYADMHPDILMWASEELIIPYRSPVDGKVHRYFPDFIIKKKSQKGVISIVLIEIKPLAYTKPPTKKKTINKKYIEEVMQWGVNSAKWEAAIQYCKSKKWEFSILTEKELNIKW